MVKCFFDNYKIFAVNWQGLQYTDFLAIQLVVKYSLVNNF
jgi:hypothetical protein